MRTIVSFVADFFFTFGTINKSHCFFLFGLIFNEVVSSMLAGSRVTQGNFTPTFPRNRTWESPIIRLFLFHHKCINTSWNNQSLSLAVILFHNNESSLFRLLSIMKLNKLIPSLHPVSRVSSLPRISPPPESRSIPDRLPLQNGLQGDSDFPCFVQKPG